MTLPARCEHRWRTRLELLGRLQRLPCLWWAACCLAASAPTLLPRSRLSRRRRGPRHGQVLACRTCVKAHRHARRFRLVNYYAKFASMHAFRWEVLLEGLRTASAESLRLPLQTVECARSSAVGTVHLPRLDWRLWLLLAAAGARAVRATGMAACPSGPSIVTSRGTGPLDMQRNPFPDVRHACCERVASFASRLRAAADPWEVVLPP